MDFGTNTTTYYIILPLIAIVAALIIWFVARTKVSAGKKLALCALGIFAFVGFSVLTLCVYYHVNDHFAATFKYYAYSALAPDSRSPFDGEDHDQSVLMIRVVRTENGEVSVLEHPNPYAPTLVELFLSGKFVTADMFNNVLTLPDDDLDREVPTSLWWALTKDIYVQVGDANNWEASPVQELGHDFTSQVPTGWKLSDSQSDLLNTVKFGSPVEYHTFIPASETVDENDMYTGPIISASSFTIDENLSARDVANLIQDQGIADQIERGTDACLFSGDVHVDGIGYYAYISDNTDLTQCTDLGTEVAKSRTLVLKNEGDSRALIVTLTTANNNVFADAYYSLREFVNLMKLDNTSFQLSKQNE